MGQKKLVNQTNGDIYVSFLVRQGDSVGQTDTTGEWNWTVPAAGVVWANYAPETYLNGVEAQYLNSANGETGSTGITVLVKSNADDNELNRSDTFTFTLSGTNLLISYSNTWT